MTPTDLKLYELLGDKTLSFGCVMENEYASEQNPNRYFHFCQKHSDTMEWYSFVTGKRVCIIDDKISKTNIIGHEPTSTDLFKWMIDNDCAYATLWLWDDCLIFYGEGTGRERVKIPFDLSKKLIDQSEETKLAIISLITSHS